MNYELYVIQYISILSTFSMLLSLCPTLCNPIEQPTRHPRPWDSPGKNTGMGCHFLLQCMKVKSESEVAQSCPTLSDPMDCSPPGSSVHGTFQARVLEWGAIAFSGRAWALGLKGSVVLVPWLWSTGSMFVAHGLSCLKACGIGTYVSCIAKWILNHWTTREAP